MVQVAPAETTVVHRSLDGRRFSLTGPLDLSQPFTSTIELVVHGRRHELVAGSAELGAELTGSLGMPGFEEELDFAGGRLLIGRSRRTEPGTNLVEDLLLAAWQGKRYSLVGQFFGTSADIAVDVLRTVRIAEHDDGVAIEPLASAGSTFATPATVVKQVPLLGLLELTVPSAPQASRLPQWRGVSTPSGELFTDQLSNGDPYFVLAGEDTWASVLPLADTELDRVPALLGQLRLRLLGAR